MTDYIADDYAAISKAMRDLNLKDQPITRWGVWYPHDETWCYVRSGSLRSCKGERDREPSLYGSKEEAEMAVTSCGASRAVVVKPYISS